MKQIFLTLGLLVAGLACLSTPAFAQVPFGGPTAVPPPPDQFGANQAPNGGTFAGCSSFTACGWSTNPACASIDSSTSHSGTNGSAKLVNCGSGSNISTLEAGNLHMNGDPAFYVSFWVKTDSSANLSGVSLTGFDNTHGDGAAMTLGALTGPGSGLDMAITANSGWQQYFELLYNNPIGHGGDTNLQIRLNVSGLTAGTLWIADVQIQSAWRAMRTFLIYPNYRGYLISGVAPPSRYSPGVVPVAGQIDGVSEINPPSGDTLTQLTLLVKMATVPGCASGVLATDTVVSPAAKQFWQFTPSQYGTLTSGTNYYLCSTLELTSGPTLIDSYPDWSVVPEPSSFFASLYNYYDANGTWIHNGKPTFLLGLYDRYAGQAGLALCQTSSACIANYAGNAPMGFGLLPQALGSPAPSRGSRAADFSVAGADSVIDFAQYSAVDPFFPSSPPGDELTARIQTAASFGWAHWQEASYFFGCLTTATTTCAAPAFSPSVTPGTGSISANYLFLEWVSAAAPAPQGNSPAPFPPLTLPSNPVTVNLSAAACAGANCSVTFTAPSCASSRQIGGLLYAATGATSTPPANTAFSRQFPAFSGGLAPSDYIPCGASVTLSSLDANSIAPPASDNTSGGQPNWRGTASDATILQDFSSVLCSNSYPAGAAGWYIGDEYSFYSMPTTFYLTQIMDSQCAATPTAGLDIGASLPQFTRDLFDVIGSDPYGSTDVASPDEYTTGEGIPRNGTNNFYTTNNVLGSTTSYPSRTDFDTDAVARNSYGSRPTWMVIRMYGNSTYTIPAYAEYQQNLWKAIIDCQIYGSTGCGVLGWGWVSSVGMEHAAYDTGNSLAWFDAAKALNEVKVLEPVLLTPVQDSPQLGLGAVVSGVFFNRTVASACNIQSGMTSMYTNSANRPNAPANFVTHTYTPPNTDLTDQYIFATNLCDLGTSSPTIQTTFTFPSVPAASSVEVLNEGRSLPISTSGCPDSQPACFTDTWNSMDAHIYAIRAPRGMTIH
ncbi:MAG: hypothetical protein WAL55_07385 [Candidatus Acidiferrales bacterium]